MAEADSHLEARMPRTPVVDDAARKQWVALISQFQKLDPPKYRGEEGPEAAEDFINEMEKIFGVLGCTPREKMMLGEFSIQRTAEAWWRASKEWAVSAYPGDDWEVFKNTFLGKFFPYSFREDRALEFAGLVQGASSVDEYEGRSASLSRYRPSMKGEAKARKFELGLEPSIRLQVSPFMITSYEELCRKAQNVEKALVAVKARDKAEEAKRA